MFSLWLLLFEKSILSDRVWALMFDKLGGNVRGVKSLFATSNELFSDLFLPSYIS